MTAETCAKCGQGNLTWKQTAAGKWYLTDIEGTSIVGENGNTIKVLRLAHKCKTQEQKDVEVRDLQRFARFTELCRSGVESDTAVAQMVSELGREGQ